MVLRILRHGPEYCGLGIQVSFVVGVPHFGGARATAQFPLGVCRMCRKCAVAHFHTLGFGLAVLHGEVCRGCAVLFLGVLLFDMCRDVPRHISSGFLCVVCVVC